MGEGTFFLLLDGFKHELAVCLLKCIGRIVCDVNVLIFIIMIDNRTRDLRRKFR